MRWRSNPWPEDEMRVSVLCALHASVKRAYRLASYR
jgi:hypothetical protein